MVYLKSIIRNSSGSITASVCLLLLCCAAEAGISKIAYKKPILVKDKSHQKLVKTTTVSLTGVTDEIASATTEIPANADLEITTGITLTLTPKEEKSTLENDFKSTTAMSNEISSTTSSSSFNTATTTASLPAGKVSSNDEDNFPCTCGIFLSSQFTKGSADPPRGEAIISNSLGRSFPCNSVGQKQCQTKCLEQIVQHLPNSANILCASLDRDIQKERAYLFIKNCQNQWINTNLAAGREYCCKNREPCRCK